jgi:hypothetical protein
MHDLELLACALAEPRRAIAGERDLETRRLCLMDKSISGIVQSRWESARDASH